MKTILKKWQMLLMLVLTLGITACSDDNGGNGDNGDDDGDNLSDILFENGTQLGNGADEMEINGNYKLPKGVYVMKGWLYITDGSSLEIEAGTVIKGDKATKAAIIAEPGGKLIARGRQDAPIVFTSNEPVGSRKPGDWGGIILCGKAVNNQGKMTIEGGLRTEHGGNDNADNSGVLSYVRVEFAGNPFDTDQEINGVTFGSVGSGTQVDHVQVSYSNDDSFEWFGGSVNCKYLVAYHGWDDDFDTDNGFSGKVQFCLGVRDPGIADQSISNGFESDNNGNGTTQEPFTKTVFSNVTFVGPVGQDPAFQNTTEYIKGNGLNPNNGSRLGQFQAAIQIRRNSHLSCFNSVAMGYPVGLLIENDKGSQTQEAAKNEVFKLNHIVFAGMGILGSDKNKSLQGGLCTDGTNIDATQTAFSETYFNTATGNVAYPAIADLKLSQPNSMAASPNYGPLTGSPLLGAADFTDVLLSSGFDKVSYIGAFASDKEADNWMSGWTNFDPQHTSY